MPRGRKKDSDFPGQMVFSFCLDQEQMVAQSNDIIGGKQALKLNSAKLIRAAIMQIKPDDTELKPYIISIKDFADMIGVPTSNVYRDANKITDNILKNPIKIKGKNGRWVKFPWVKRCEYSPDAGIAITLNDELKPFLIQLVSHGNYTQYALEEVMQMKSVYAIRIFELLKEQFKTKVLPKEGIYVELSIKKIRDCCDLYIYNKDGDQIGEKYASFSNFKVRVLDTAVNEINKVTSYRVSYEYLKTGKKVTSIMFHLNMVYH